MVPELISFLAFEFYYPHKQGIHEESAYR
jgi:hypothetical protein